MGLIVGYGTLPVRLDAMNRPGYSVSLAGFLRGDWIVLRARVDQSLTLRRGLGVRGRDYGNSLVVCFT